MSVNLGNRMNRPRISQMKALTLQVFKGLIFSLLLQYPQIAQADEIESAYKAVEWERTFGGKGSDAAFSIVSLADGGAMIAGYTESKGQGSYDAWVIRINGKGNLVWDKTFGSKASDSAISLVALPDGGAMIAGQKLSTTKGLTDAWVFRIDAQGNLIWEKTYGGNKFDATMAMSITSLPDGGAMVAAKAAKGTDLGDVWVFRIDGDGNIIWEKTFGKKNSTDNVRSIISLPDDGAMIAGSTYSDKIATTAAWVLRLDARGHLVWERTFGEKNERNAAQSITQLSDGGAVIVGLTLPKSKNNFDAFAIRIDEMGNFIWQKKFGGDGYDSAKSIVALPNDNVMIAAITSSRKFGKKHAWLIHLDENGNEIWDRTYGKENTVSAHSLVAVTDESLMLAGEIYRKNSKKADAWVLRTNRQGKSLTK